jgi:chromosome segregation ATPase
MQLVVTRVAAATAVASEVTTRTTLEATKQSAEDRATTALSVAATTTTERDALATRLALPEEEIERLWAAATFANEAAERDTTSFAAAEASARDVARAAAQEKAEVTDLEWDLAAAGADLATANHQFSEVSTQLQVASEEVTRLREDDSKLSQGLDGESNKPFFSPPLLLACFCSF